MIEAPKHSASDAVELLSGVTPLRLRLRELCIREFFKIKSKKRSNPLVSYLENAKTIKNKFTSLSYLKSASRNLNRKLEDWDIKVAQTNPITPEDMMAQRSMERLDIIHNVGSSKSRTKEQEEAAKEAIEFPHK